MSKSEVDIEFLITLVEARPVLWDKTLESYKDKSCTRNAWVEICQELNSEFDKFSDEEKKQFVKNITKKWWNIRDNFVRCRKRYKEARRFSTGSPNVRKYIYNDQLQFLLKVTEDQKPDILSDTLSAEEIIITDEGSSQDGAHEEIPPLPPLIKLKPRLQPNQNPQKRKLHPSMEMKVVQLFDDSVNRHVSFFKGILPSLDNFDDDQCLEFQMGVLKLITDIKRKKVIKEPASPL